MVQGQSSDAGNCKEGYNPKPARERNYGDMKRGLSFADGKGLKFILATHSAEPHNNLSVPQQSKFASAIALPAKGFFALV